MQTGELTLSDGADCGGRRISRVVHRRHRRRRRNYFGADVPDCRASGALSRWGRTSSRQGSGRIASTGRYIKNGYVDWKLGVPSIVLALVGAHFGTKPAADDRGKIFAVSAADCAAGGGVRGAAPAGAAGRSAARSRPKSRWRSCARASLVVGAYDGFYGPGTGTFLLLIFCNLAKMDVRTAGGNVKLVNLASNMGALFTSLMSGKVFIALRPHRHGDERRRDTTSAPGSPSKAARRSSSPRS